MDKPARNALASLTILALGLAVTRFASWAGERRSITPEASIASLGMRIENVAWLQDHMEHGGRIPMPESMMPDMPMHGQHRLSVAITIYNRGQERQRFRVAELELRSSAGGRWIPSSTTTETMTLSNGQLAHVFLQFDVPSARGDSLQLVWQRGRREQAMGLIPIPPTDSTMHHASEDDR